MNQGEFDETEQEMYLDTYAKKNITNSSNPSTAVTI
jgi:hypothetical protein